jgi:hypothetical protein
VRVPIARSGVRHLDGDQPLQLVVMSEGDEAEAALPQDFLHPVATNVRRQGSFTRAGRFDAARLERTSFVGVVHGSVRPGLRVSATAAILPKVLAESHVEPTHINVCF